MVLYFTKIILWFALGFILVCLLPLATAQQNYDTVQVRSSKITDGVFMLIGSGGNLGVSAGEDGIFIIDDQFAPLTEKIKKAIVDATKLSSPIRFVLNTHWHGDHTGGNENMGKAGAVIIAHNNVRKRMSVKQFNKFFDHTTPASPKDALPIVTFSTDVTFHLNGDSIHVFHVDTAHTDGDAIVHFTKANVIHLGDVFFSGRYPFIDLSSGGSVNGLIAATEKVLHLINPKTKIIPGHGPLSTAKELQEYHNMLVSVRERVARLIADGKTLDEIKTAKPTAQYDDSWGKGFVSPDRFIETLYDNLSNRK